MAPTPIQRRACPGLAYPYTETLVSRSLVVLYHVRAHAVREVLVLEVFFQHREGLTS